MTSDKSVALRASLAKALEFLERVLATPRAAFRAAGDAGMVDNVERWLDYLEARNLTSHTYNDITASQVYAVVSGTFATDVRALLASDE